MVKQTKNTDKKKRRKILLATLIPVGAVVVATAITLPIVLTKKSGTVDEKEVQVDENGWKEAFNYFINNLGTWNFTRSGTIEAGKADSTVKFDGKNEQVTHLDEATGKMETYYYRWKQLNISAERYDKDQSKWVDTEIDTMDGPQIVEMSNMFIDKYEVAKDSYVDGVYSFKYSSKIAAKISFIKLADGYRVKQFDLEFGGKYYGSVFKDYGTTKLDDFPA